MFLPTNRSKDIIKKYESCRLVAYLDANGIPTIGWGHTHDVKMGDVITQEEADMLFDFDLHYLLEYLNSPGVIIGVINQNQVDALISLIYNIGIRAFRDSTLRDYVNEGYVSLAADEFPKWRKSGGKILKGLVKRRAEERSLFMKKL
jgi:lysozyme